ncbi:MAG: phosphate/phosphite/phosphonate ABC transporter substrate-binding protein [Campylobacterales bacterium]|nr:phosphate/phosphite/phosphonate ABC transporter substrate-binding protein [Campylobacterales bacterium]
MKALITIFLVFSLCKSLTAHDTLTFGVISTVEVHLMEKKLTPLIKYLEKKTNKKIVFQSGYNYQDTINKFADGTFDIGFIGPSPYIKVKKKQPNALIILAKLENIDNNSFRSVIISKKGSSIRSLSDLSNKSFAFGSPNSTLSYYVPMKMLIDEDKLKSLEKYNFLGRHDKVAQYVIIGKYDAGAIKKSVADKYVDYLQNIATSEVYPDFLIVANSKVEQEITTKIQEALLELRDVRVLKEIKTSAIGFQKTNEDEYKELELVMKKVDDYMKEE